VYVIWLLICVALVALLVLLGILALKFGYDSREVAQSKELELASLGVNWTEPIVAPKRVGRVRRVRRRVARALYALAEWLSPGIPVPQA